jgi:hypothetical protein
MVQASVILRSPILEVQGSWPLISVIDINMMHLANNVPTHAALTRSV